MAVQFSMGLELTGPQQQRQLASSAYLQLPPAASATSGSGGQAA
jgi:hypothetical protein